MPTIDIENAGDDLSELVAALTDLVVQDARIAFSGAHVKKASDLTGQNVTTETVVTWDTEVIDVGDWHGPGSPERLTVPAGIEQVDISCNLQINSATGDEWAQIFLRHYNSSAALQRTYSQNIDVTATIMRLNLAAIAVPVAEGDYFIISVQVQTDTSVDINAANSNFAIKRS